MQLSTHKDDTYNQYSWIIFLHSKSPFIPLLHTIAKTGQYSDLCMTQSDDCKGGLFMPAIVGAVSIISIGSASVFHIGDV